MNLYIVIHIGSNLPYHERDVFLLFFSLFIFFILVCDGTVANISSNGCPLCAVAGEGESEAIRIPVTRNCAKRFDVLKSAKRQDTSISGAGLLN